MEEKELLGGYKPSQVAKIIKETTRSDGEPARPEPYYGFLNRLHHAWNVLTYKADALYWNK